MNTLRCLSLNGEIRYELPARFHLIKEGYAIYTRKDPVVIHHKKQKTFVLDNPEVILVSLFHHHCISYAFDKNGLIKNAYININLVPTSHADGHEWRDLELDIKMTRSFDGRLRPYIVDYDEFLKASLPMNFQAIAANEISRMLARCLKPIYPWSHIDKPWLDLRLDWY